MNPDTKSHDSTDQEVEVPKRKVRLITAAEAKKSREATELAKTLNSKARSARPALRLLRFMEAQYNLARANKGMDRKLRRRLARTIATRRSK